NRGQKGDLDALDAQRKWITLAGASVGMCILLPISAYKSCQTEPATTAGAARSDQKDVWSLTPEQVDKLRSELSGALTLTGTPALVNVVASDDAGPEPAKLAQQLADAINGVPDWKAVVASDSRIMFGVRVELNGDAAEIHRVWASILARALFDIGLAKSADVRPGFSGVVAPRGGQKFTNAKMTITVAPNP
ncbi:MAG TPA: hypothetical protein VF765_11025, partial [Polyangiaceae bacterium]